MPDIDPNTKLSEHFRRKEFACKGENCCGHSCVVSNRLLSALEELRDSIQVSGQPERSIKVLSGYRCFIHNKREGGSQYSKHTSGEAADLSIPKGHTVDTFLRHVESVSSFHHGGIGVSREGNGYIHVDVRRNGPTRWHYENGIPVYTEPH